MTVFTIISYNNNDWIVWILFPNIIIILYYTRNYCYLQLILFLPAIKEGQMFCQHLLPLMLSKNEDTFNILIIFVHPSMKVMLSAL